MDEKLKYKIALLSFVNLSLLVVIPLLAYLLNMGALLVLYLVPAIIAVLLAVLYGKWKFGFMFNVFMAVAALSMFGAVLNNWGLWVTKNYLSTPPTEIWQVILVIVLWLAGIFSVILYTRGRYLKKKS